MPSALLLWAPECRAPDRLRRIPAPGGGESDQKGEVQNSFQLHSLTCIIADRLLMGGSGCDESRDGFFAGGSAGEAEGSGSSIFLCVDGPVDGTAPTKTVRGMAMGVEVMGGSVS